MSYEIPPTNLATVRVRLLREVRSLLQATSAAHNQQAPTVRRLRVIRGHISVTVGIAAAKLHESGFAQVDRLYRIRDELGEGRALSGGDIVWLDQAIDEEVMRE